MASIEITSPSPARPCFSNRILPVGYQITTVWFEGGAPRYEVFAAGWRSRARRSAWGRPVDVLVTADGALLVSDERAGAVYRISYGR